MTTPACPVPLPPGETITLAHGEGARLSRALIRDEILAALGNPYLDRLADAATLPPVAGRLVFTTDSHVVTPLFFPGGDIGSLAVHGTVNDLAVCGAVPLYLSLGLVIEEGFALADLRRILRSVGETARACGVLVVTGDTKVVPRGAADGLFLTTAGVGREREGVPLGLETVRPGDAVLVNGPVGGHGIAILAARENLFANDALQSDTAPLHGLVGALLDAGFAVRFLRDATRGGVAAVLHEMTAGQSWGVLVEEDRIPVSPAVRGACEMLGLDPLHVACEGRLVAVVSAEDAGKALAVMHAHPMGRYAAVIGTVNAGDPGRVALRGPFGRTRRLIEPAGAPLPRIC